MNAMDDGPQLALDARWYTDSEVFEREQELIFERTWQLVCHVSELERPGDYVVRNVGRTALLVVRDRSGRIRACHNVCRHRAHELLSGKRNRVSTTAGPMTSTVRRGARTFPDSTARRSAFQRNCAPSCPISTT